MKSLDKISLCQSCNCMTKTIKGKCGKCGKMKSLDKKKTNIEIVDTDIFSIGTDGGNKPIKPINLDKKKAKELTYNKHVTKVYKCDMSESKEPVKRILIKTRSTGKTMQNTSNLCKPKELEWEKTFYDNFCSIERNPYSNETFYIVDGNERNPEKYLKFIQSLLTQQRSELLEEILEENFCDLDGTYDYDGIAQSVIDLHKKL